MSNTTQRVNQSEVRNSHFLNDLLTSQPFKKEKESVTD